MNEQQLQRADGTKIDAFQCGVCGLVYPEREPYSSSRCCKCADCGAMIPPKGGRKTYCDKCWGPYYAKIDADRLDRAVELPNYAGPVVVGDRYWESVEDLIDTTPDDELPSFAHTCHIESYSIDAEDIIQNMLENSGVEDADEHKLDGVGEFKQAVAAFNEANKKNVYWIEDSKHKVRVEAEQSINPPEATDGEA